MNTKLSSVLPRFDVLRVRIWSAGICHRFRSLGVLTLRVRVGQTAYETAGCERVWQSEIPKAVTSPGTPSDDRQGLGIAPSYPRHRIGSLTFLMPGRYNYK